MAAILAALLLSGCGSDVVPRVVPPPIIVPPGVVSSQTADQVAQKMLAEIEANERKLGRSLAPARIIRIQLLRKGELYEARHFDGSNPQGFGMSPDGGPGWMVEAVGTFIGEDPTTGRIDSLGTHGFHLWDDEGGESTGFIPCWTRLPTPPDLMEGQCQQGGDSPSDTEVEALTQELLGVVDGVGQLSFGDRLRHDLSRESFSFGR